VFVFIRSDNMIMQSTIKRLEGRVAIITGSSSGIGAAVAEAYAGEGAKVVINYSQNRSGAEEIAACIAAAGGQSIIVEADVSKADDVRRMVEKTHEAFGPVDTLVNNAGIYPRDAWDTLTEQQWDRVLDVNLKGCFLCAYAVYEDMKAAGYGKIINVSSIAFVGGIGLVHYGSSKAGIVGFTRGLAVALGSYNICVNAVLPGAIKVDREMELDSAETRAASDRGAIAAQCIKRRATPIDTVGAFIFFASHESDWITGHCLAVDGGLTKY